MPDRRPLSRLLPRQREGLPDVAVIRSGRPYGAGTGFQPGLSVCGKPCKTFARQPNL
jgi:hypothetical protein